MGEDRIAIDSDATRASYRENWEDRVQWAHPLSDIINSLLGAGSAHGPCGPTALVVQDLLGGDLLVADVTGGTEHDEVHYWNRFAGGVEFDLTREQFEPHRIIGSPALLSGRREGRGRMPRNTRYSAHE
jgi:hypothetical protein